MDGSEKSANIGPSGRSSGATRRTATSEQVATGWKVLFVCSFCQRARKASLFPYVRFLCRPEWGIKGGFEDPSSSSARSELNLRGGYVVYLVQILPGSDSGAKHGRSRERWNPSKGYGLVDQRGRREIGGL